jgi:hypothetical protein
MIKWRINIMSDKELINALRDYAKVYSNGQPYNFNPGLALMAANRIEQLSTATHIDKIGDKIWVADCYDEWFVINKEYYICAIKTHTDYDYQRVAYVIKSNDGDVQELIPSFCFNSYEECQQWCDKQNKKEAKQC